MRVECRNERAPDIESIYKLNCEAFETEAEAKLVDALRKAKKLVLSMVAADGDEIVGHIAFSRMNLPSQGRRKLAGLAPMAVAKARQKQGISSLLIQAGENSLKELGYDAIFVLGHKDYYPKFGYKPSFSNFGIKSKYEVEDVYFLAKPLSEDGVSGLSGTILYESEFDSV
ncbi:MAG: N-acetyltransferase [Bdellovibrionales bacterium]|nr:N-acetyltransferase [Bdellovibrionales bacterium]